jgi:hypothetical protein
MGKAANRIRPSPEYLQQLPTLAVETDDQGREALRESCRRHGFAWAQELKLVTPEVRYWITTRGLKEIRAGMDEGFVIGFVTPEDLNPDGTWETGRSYGPQETTWFQGKDYYRMLSKEHTRLVEQQAQKPSQEFAKQIQATFREMEMVMERLQRKGYD